MPKKLDFNEVSCFFEKHNCKLLSKTYENSKQKLDYLCKCGHIRTSDLKNIKSKKLFLCKNCTINKHFIKQDNQIHPKTFTKNKKLLENRLFTYRNDFHPSFINIKQTCFVCNKDKYLYLFYNDKRGKYNKQKECKSCNKKNKKERVKKLSIEQQMKMMLKTTLYSSKRRKLKGRKECGINNLTIEDIVFLKDKQNNKCVYSGEELIWETNNIYKASIDRIDSEKGYTLDNVQLVCLIVNQMKSNLNEKEFLDIINKISNNIYLKNNKLFK